MAEEITTAEQPVTEAPVVTGGGEQQPPAPKYKLWKALNSSDYYTKSYDEFNRQFSTPEAINKLHDKLTHANYYTKSYDEFNKQFFSDSTPVSVPEKKNPIGNVSAPGLPTSAPQFDPSHQLDLSNPVPQNNDAQVVAAQADNEHNVHLIKEAVKSPTDTLIKDYATGMPANLHNLTSPGFSIPANLQTEPKNVVTKKQFDDAKAHGMDMIYSPELEKGAAAFYASHPEAKLTLPTDQGTFDVGHPSTFGDVVKRGIMSFDAGVLEGVADLRKVGADLADGKNKLLVKAGLMDAGTAENRRVGLEASQTAFEKEAQLGLDENYLNNNPVAAIGKMVPMLLGGESNGARIAGLQAWGSASKNVDRMKAAGIKFENGSDILYKGGAYMINYFLMKDVLGSTLLKSTGQETFNGIMGAAAADAVNDLAVKGIDATWQDYASAYYMKALSLSAKVGELGMGAVKTYAKVGADFAIANLANLHLEGMVNAINKQAYMSKWNKGEAPVNSDSRPTFDIKGSDIVDAVISPFYNNDNPAKGSLIQFVSNILTSPAAAFSMFHVAQSAGMLFSNSPYLSPAIAELQKDSTPEGVQRVKDNLVKYGQANGWTPEDLQATAAKVDELADIATKVPNGLKAEKFGQAVNLIMDRRHMEGVLEGVQANKSKIDPAMLGKASAFEDLLNANIEQANDRLNVLVTDKPFTYFEHQGEYFKVQEGGEPQSISKARYDLEGVNKVRGSLSDSGVVMPEGTADKKGNPLPPKVSADEPVPAKTDISDEEYTKFIDDGVVGKESIDNIALKVRDKQPLSFREKAIFADKTEEINKSIQQSLVKPEAAQAKSEPVKETNVKVKTKEDELNEIPEVKRQLEYTKAIANGNIGDKVGITTIDRRQQTEAIMDLKEGSLVYFKKILNYHKRGLERDIADGEDTTYHQESINKYKVIVDKLQEIEDRYKDNANPESPEAVTPNTKGHGEDETKTETQEKGRKEEVLNAPEKAEPVKDQAPAFSNEQEAERHWLQHETDPEAIAAHYHQQNFNTENVADYKEHLIHNVIGNSKINLSDYKEHSDINNLSGDNELTKRIDKSNGQQPVDRIAHEISTDNVQVTPADIVAFIDKYPTTNAFQEGNISPMKKELADRYHELTGGNLTDKRAQDAYDKQQEAYKAAKLSDNARDIINAEGITPANVDKLRDMFKGFPYTEEDFNNVKRYLDEQAKTTKPASGTASPSPGAKSEGVGQQKPERTVTPKQPAAAPAKVEPEKHNPIVTPTDGGQEKAVKKSIVSAKSIVAKRNANPDGGGSVKKAVIGLSDKDKAAVDELRRRMRDKLNLPPDHSSGGDEFDEELHDDGLKLTRLYFKAGIRSFPDFAELMIGDMGEAISDYLPSFYEGAKNSPGFNRSDFDTTDDVDYYMAKLNETVAPEQVFVDRIKDAINKGDKLNITAIEGIASQAGIPATVRTHLQEYVERALIELARDIIDNPLFDDKDKFDEIVKLYDRQPALNQRSSTKVLLQQYSTPLPYALSAGLYVDKLNPNRVYDPTAGTGMMLIAFDPSKAITNEIDPLRVKILQQLGYAPTTVDASGNVPVIKVDGVMANPPFGAASSPVSFHDYKFNKLDYIIPLKALANMKDGGRAAIIIGGHSSYDRGMLIGGDFQFLNYLHHYYNVTDVINVDGSLYAKQGTSFPTRLILINGRKEVPQDYAPVENVETNKPVKSFEDLYNRIQERINQDENPTVLQSRVDVQLNPGDNINVRGSGEVQPTETGGSGTVSGTKSDEPGGAGVAGKEPGNTGPGRQTEFTGKLDFPVGNSEGDNAGGELANVPEPLAKFAPVAEAGTIGPEGTGEFIPADRPLSANRPTADQLVNDEKVSYTSASRLTEAGSVIPSNMAYETEQNLKDIEALYGPIDTFVANELGYHDLDDLNNAFFAEQVDAIAMAIHQLKQGSGIIIGDMTGLGKGRCAAGLIRWVVNQGQIPTFFTENADLFSDIYRDLHGIGSGHLVPFIVNDPSSDRDANVKRNGKVIYAAGTIKQKRQFFESKRLPHGTKVILSTYSQINSDKQTLKRGFISHHTKGGYMFLDESHNVAGDSNSGLFFQDLLAEAKGAVFFSATYAKRADNMPVYALKTSMKDANMSNQALVDAILAGGNALQEIVASQLVKAGQMIRRERDFTGVENTFITLGVDKDGKPDDIGMKHRELADQVIDVCNAIIDFENTHVVPAMADIEQKLKKGGKKIAQTKSKSLSVSNTPFASKMFNIVNQMLFSIKAPELAQEAIRELRENNRKPVISFNSTMESFIKNGGFKPGDEVNDISFSASLMNGLRNTLKYRIEHPNGDKEVAFFDLEDLGPEVKEAWNEVVEMIKAASADMSISPIDTITEILEKEGLKVGEITGRGMKLRFNDDHTAANVESIGTRDTAGIIHDFNNGGGGGKADVILLNAAGATGFSMHADKSFKDQRQRVMINGQFELDINKEIQKRGRIDRTNQVARGAFKYLNTAIPAETRLAMMVSDKLKKLQANTAGDQKSKANEVKVIDFLNEYGDQVMTDYLQNHPDIYQRLFHGADPAGIKDIKPGQNVRPTDGIARKTTGRAALLKVAEQEAFYNEVAQSYVDYIDYLNSTDQNTLAVKSVNLDAKLISKGVFIEGKHTQSPFGQDSILEQVEANVLRKPMSKEELEADIEDNLNGKSPVEARRELVGRLHEYYSNAIQKGTEHYEDRADEADAKAKKKFGANIELYNIAREENQALMAKNIEDLENRMNEAAGKMESLFNFMHVGSEQMVPSSISGTETKYTKGIFLGFTLKEKKASNPFTPSNVLMSFAVLDGKRKITVSASRGEFVNALYAGKAQLSRSELERMGNLRKDWEETVKNTKARETRYIVTGNILQAFKPNMGHLVSYTTSTGSIAKGILLPKDFNPGKEGKTVGAVGMYEKIMALTEGNVATSTDGRVTIEKNNRAFVMSVPKSTKEGGKYFKNEKLLQLAEFGEFYTYGGKMMASFKNYQLMDLLKVLEGEFSLKFNTGIELKSADDSEHGSEDNNGGGKLSKSNSLITPNSGELESDDHHLLTGKSTERVQASNDIPTGPDGEALPAKKLPEIMSSLAEGLNVKMYYASSKRKNSAGSYNASTGGIKLSIVNNLDVAIHEVGHALDDRFQIFDTIPTGDQSAIMDELQWFADRGGSNPPAHLDAAKKIEYLKREGIAEFVRAYAINRNQANARAPKFYAHFENVVPGEVLDVIDDFGNDYLRYINSTALDNIMANIEEVPHEQRPAYRRFIESIYGDKGEFNLTPFDKLQVRLTNSGHAFEKSYAYILNLAGGSIDTIAPAGNARDLSLLFAGVDGKIGSFFDNGIVNGKNEPIIDGRTGQRMNIEWLLSAFDSTSEATLKQDQALTIAYMFSLRTVEKVMQFGRPSGISGISAAGDKTDSDIALKFLIKEFGQDMPREQKIRILEGHRRYHLWADKMMRYMVEKGRMSESTYQDIKEKNVEYVAFLPVQENFPGIESYFDNVSALTKGAAVGNVKTVIREMTGSTAYKRHPYISLMQNTAAMIKEADRNEILQSYVEPMMNTIRAMGDGRVNPFANIMMEVNSVEGAQGKPVMTVYINGRAKFFMFSPEAKDVYEYIKGLTNLPRLPWLATALPKLLRWTATRSPVFAKNHLIRSTFTRLIVSRTGSGLGSFIRGKRDNEKELYALFGGSQNGYWLGNRVDYYKLQNQSIKDLASKGKTMVINPAQWAKIGWKAYMNLLHQSDLVNRTAEFRKAYQKAIAPNSKGGLGYDEQNANMYAAMQAKDLLNASVAGTWLRYINAVIPFANVEVQGLKRNIKAATEGNFAGLGLWAMRMALYLGTATVLMRLLAKTGGYEEDYDNLPAYQRDNGWNFKVPGQESWIYIPKPYDSGLLASGMDRMMGSFGPKGQNAWYGYDKTIFQSLFLMKPEMAVGPMADIVEPMTNYSFFKQGPIVPRYEEDKALALRHRFNTASRLSKGIAWGLSPLYKEGDTVDPRYIDEMMQTTFSYYGDWGMSLSDIGSKESRHKFGLSSTGFIKEQQISGDARVEKLYNLSKELGLDNTKPIHDLSKLIGMYYDATQPDERKKLHGEIMGLAKTVYNSWVTNDLYKQKIEKKGKPINFN